jgi:hypothetical protein
MEIGDLVRLKQPFSPTPTVPEYCFGIIAGIVWSNPTRADLSEVTEIVLYLYEPDRDLIYTDELGIRVLYSFYPHELEGVKEER